MSASKIQTDLIGFANGHGLFGAKSETPGRDGEPDLKFLFRWGRWYYIEVKWKKDKLKPLQAKRIRDYRKLGQICYVIKTVEEGKNILLWHKTRSSPYPHYKKENEKC